MDDFDKFSEEIRHGKRFGGRLEKWTIVPFEVDGEKYSIAYGYIYGDPMRRFGEGSNMRTSVILTDEKDRGYIVTRNTVYELGEKATDNEAMILQEAPY